MHRLRPLSSHVNPKHLKCAVQTTQKQPFGEPGNNTAPETPIRLQSDADAVDPRAWFFTNSSDDNRLTTAHPPKPWFQPVQHFTTTYPSHADSLSICDFPHGLLPLLLQGACKRDSKKLQALSPERSLDLVPCNQKLIAPSLGPSQNPTYSPGGGGVGRERENVYGVLNLVKVIDKEESARGMAAASS